MVSGPLPAPPPPERGDRDEPTIRDQPPAPHRLPPQAPPRTASPGGPPSGAPPWGASPPSGPPPPGWQAPPRRWDAREQRGTDGVAIAALVTGIVGILASLVPFIGALFSLPLGLAAIVCGIVALRRGVQRGLGIAGLVMGVVAFLITIAWWALLIPFRNWQGFEEFGNLSVGLLHTIGLS